MLKKPVKIEIRKRKHGNKKVKKGDNYNRFRTLKATPPFSPTQISPRGRTRQGDKPGL